MPFSWRLACFAWGFAEATFFLVVPDVLLTVIAQRCGVRAALAGVAFAVGGAVSGGLVMWVFGAGDPELARAFLDVIPAISPDMIAAAEAALARSPFALFAGAFSGVPYKVFAAVAPSAGLPLPALLALTAVSRAARFFAVVAVAFMLDRLLARRFALRARTLVLAAAWIGFYAVYWSITPS